MFGDLALEATQPPRASHAHGIDRTLQCMSDLSGCAGLVGEDGDLFLGPEALPYRLIARLPNRREQPKCLLALLISKALDSSNRTPQPAGRFATRNRPIQGDSDLLGRPCPIAGNIGLRYLRQLDGTAAFLREELLNIASPIPFSGLLHLHPSSAQPLTGLGA